MLKMDEEQHGIHVTSQKLGQAFSAHAAKVLQVDGTCTCEGVRRARYMIVVVDFL